MRGAYRMSVLRIIFIMSVLGMGMTQYIFVNFAFAQSLEEKIKEVKIAQPFQSFEAEIKSMQSFIEKLDAEIIEALKARNSARISDLQHGKTQAMAYQTYLRVQQGYILEKAIGGKPAIKENIQIVNTEIDNLKVADESLDPLIKNKINGIGGGGGKIIKTSNPIANSLLKDLQEDIFGKNKIMFTESEAIRLRQTIHRRMARLSSAIDALEDIQVKGNVLPVVHEAQSKFFFRMKYLATAREEYLSYKRLRDFIYPSASGRAGFIANPLSLKKAPKGMQKVLIPREVSTPFKEAISSSKKAAPAAGSGIKAVVRGAGVVVGVAGTIATAYDFVTTSPNEAVVGGYLEAIRQCIDSRAHLLPASEQFGFWVALKNVFPVWAMNLGFDDVGRMIDKEFDQKFMEEFQRGMAYIEKQCPSVWNGIKNSTNPLFANFRQGILDWLGRIPEIHNPLQLEMRQKPQWKWNVSAHGLDWVAQ